MARNLHLQIVIDAVDNASKKLQGVSKKFSATAEKMTSAGTKMSLGISLPITLLGAKMISLASDAEETQGKFDVVFKGMADEANKWAKDTARALGRSQLEMKKFTSGLGDVLKPLGFTTKAAADMSQEMTKLALDVASFNNKQDSDVIRSFTAALTGERESLKSLGIVISEADVKQEAYTAGLAKAGEELSKTAKAQATMNLLFKNTEDAQGDLIRTGASFANQQKALKSAMQDLGVEFGQVFLPIATKVIEKLRSLTAWFSDLTTEQKKTILQVAAFVAALGPALLIIGLLIKTIGVASVAVAAFGTALAFLAANPIVLIIASITALVAAIVLIAKNWDTVQAGLSAGWETMKSIFVAGGQTISKFWGDLWGGVVKTFQSAWVGMQKFLANTINLMLIPINALIRAMNKLGAGISEINIDTAGLEAQAQRINQLGGTGVEGPLRSETDLTQSVGIGAAASAPINISILDGSNINIRGGGDEQTLAASIGNEVARAIDLSKSKTLPSPV